MLEARSPAPLQAQVRQWLVEQSELPLPGRGRTLQRWRALARIGAHDLALAKVLEAHHDAHAVLADLGAPVPPGDPLLAVWAAHGPGCTVRGDEQEDALVGAKPWCSGADIVDMALVTVREGARPGVYLVALDASAQVDAAQWHAPGMARIPSTTVQFQQTPAQWLGSEQAYLSRPGFWHGGAGIAAVWLGAAGALLTAMQQRCEGDHRQRLTGEAVLALTAATSFLRELAARIDADPSRSHQAEVVLARSLAERACTTVLDLAARALGPGPMCLDADHARRWADLTVFIRQSHADRDWAWLGTQAATVEHAWTL